jgi:anti-sigma-K factor RskA
MSDWLGMASPPRPPRPELRGPVLARAVARRRRAAVWAFATAAVLAVAVFGAGAWARSRIVDLERARAALSERVVALEDTLDLVRGRHTRIVQIPVTTGGRLGYVTILQDTVTHRWLVRCENLAPNEPDQAYQFWFVTENGLVAAKLMAMDTEEPMMIVLDTPKDSARVTGAAMSIEPRTGSPEPTGPTVFKRLL